MKPIERSLSGGDALDSLSSILPALSCPAGVDELSGCPPGPTGPDLYRETIRRPPGGGERPDDERVFPRENFERELEKDFSIVAANPIEDSLRILYAMKGRADSR